MSSVRSFEELKCWQQARELVRIVYGVSGEGKHAKDFSTRDQIRRAALSVMNNIAEGFGRETNREFIRFLDIAQSSAMEVKSMGYVLIDMEYLSAETGTSIQNKAEETKSLTRGLMRYLKSNNKA